MIAISSKCLLRAAVLTFALIAAPSAGYSQQKPTVTQPTTTAIALSLEILRLKGSIAMVDPIVSGVIAKVRGMHLQTNPMLSKPLNEVAILLGKEFAQVSADLQQDVAGLYATRFTEAELKLIVAFYNSPAGQKVIKEEPLIFEVTVQQLKLWEESFAEEVLSRFRAEMKKRGHEL
jgi:hypothetical protein